MKICRSNQCPMSNVLRAEVPQDEVQCRKRKRLWTLDFGLMILLILCLIAFSKQSFAIPVSGNNLVESAKLYDGQTIEFQGEVIGDIMVRGDHAWLNVNDDTRAIGIWAEKSLAQNVKTVGDYNHVGDMIKATGEFHRACAEHGGDLDIHAHEISIITEGYRVDHPIDPWKLSLVVVLFVATLSAYLFFAWKKKLKP